MGVSFEMVILRLFFLRFFQAWQCTLSENLTTRVLSVISITPTSVREHAFKRVTQSHSLLPTAAPLHSFTLTHSLNQHSYTSYKEICVLSQSLISCLAGYYMYHVIHICFLEAIIHKLVYFISYVNSSYRFNHTLSTFSAFPVRFLTVSKYPSGMSMSFIVTHLVLRYDSSLQILMFPVYFMMAVVLCT